MIIIPRRHIDPAPEEWRRFLARDAGGNAAASIRRWEEAFAEHIGRRFAIAVGSGRLAMRLLLAALKIPPEAEIIVPAYTLKDLLPIITSLGLTPVAADIDPDHWNISAATVGPVITQKTRAIIVLHLFGNPAPLPELLELADAHGVQIIEDCAHSAGSTLAGKPTGAAGSGAFFSFESIKPINTYGGGMLVSDDPDLANQIRTEIARLPLFSHIHRKLRAAAFEHLMFTCGLAALPLAILSSRHGQQMITRLYRHLQPAASVPCGYSGPQAELGLHRLSSLTARVAARQRQASLLSAWLPNSCRPQKVIPGGSHNQYFFVVKFDGDALRLRRHLLRHRFDAGYGPEIADDCSILLPGPPCPQAALLQRQALHLPLHEKTDDRHLARLAEIIGRYTG